MRVLKGIGIILGAVLLTAGVLVTSQIVGGNLTTEREQAKIQPFYDTPNPMPAGKPGDIIRQEKMTDVPDIPENADMYRILYHTQGGDGKPRISSGFAVIPKGEAPAEGRQTIAWAHGTAGMGSECAPSRSQTPLSQLTWINEAIDRGYVVAATDYAGLGTEGPQMYLIGQDEAHDVINSVRAAAQLPNANANKTYGVMGHSQGGHSSLWTGKVSPEYAPELKLVGVAGFAPAADLVTLVTNQWNQVGAWAIGPEVLVSYKIKYPDLPTEGIVTDLGMQDYEDLAQKCITEAALTGMVQEKLGHAFFTKNPLDDPQWRKVLEAETAHPLPESMPAYIAQSINDGVVTPESVANTQKEFCAAKSNLWVDWMGPLNGGLPITMNMMTHAAEGFVAGPMAMNWLYPLFKGESTDDNCAVPPAVTKNPPWPPS